jgi:hypothetical protein
MSSENIINLISTYDQNDTLNIFGQNWQQTLIESASCHFNPMIESSNLNINPCGCTSLINSINDKKNESYIIDYVCKLTQLFQNVNTPNKILLQYKFFYTSNPLIPTPSDILFSTIQAYQTTYIAFITNPSTGLNAFNVAKKTLFDLICGYVENGINNNAFGSDVIDLSSVLRVFREIIEILCEKNCKIKKSQNYLNKQNCSNNQNCLNSVIDLVEQLSALFINFDLYLPPGSQYESQLAVASTIITVTINIGTNVIYLYDFTNITLGIGPYIQYPIGTTILNFVNAYLSSLLCPCDENNQLETAITNLINLINSLTINSPPSSVQLYVTELLSQPLFLGYPIKNLGPLTDAQWFANFESLLEQIAFTLLRCSNCVKCGGCKQNCEYDILMGLYNLSTNIINQINSTIDNWYAVAISSYSLPVDLIYVFPPIPATYPTYLNFTPPPNLYLQPSNIPITPTILISSPGYTLITSGSSTIPSETVPTTAFSYVQLQFINVTINPNTVINPNDIASGGTTVNIGPYADCNQPSEQLYILIPDIVIVTGNGKQKLWKN